MHAMPWQCMFALFIKILALFCLNYGIFVISINVMIIKISSSTYFEFGILRHLAKGWVSLANLTLA
jgi:hypothetical protein